MESQQHIDTLIIRKLSGTATKEELHSLQDWLNSSEVNRRYVEQMQEIWEKSADAKIYQAIDLDKNWNEFETRSQWGQGKSRSLYSWWWQAAAVILLAVGVSWLGYTYWLSQQTVMIAASEQPLTHQLPDGSYVYLQPNSWLAYNPDFSTSAREVSFEGKAFFQVEKAGENMRFSISTFNSEVIVLGTSFTLNADAEQDSTSLLLYEGSVLFASADDSITLVPGERVSLNGNDLQKENFRVEQPLPEFNNTALSEILQAMSRKYLVAFFYEEAWPSCTISGNLNAGSLQDTLDQLGFILGLRYRIDGQLVIIEEIDCHE
jgi:ferric-dicitrate binding protein FerR (iron transport regulator)